MAKKSALYLTIARRCAAQGQTGRAVVTIVNALGNNPKYIEDHPEAIEFLAEILEPGYEEDIHRLEIRFPAFGQKLSDALKRAGRLDFARWLDESFDAYCIERMKSVMELENDGCEGEYGFMPGNYQLVAENTRGCLQTEAEPVMYGGATRQDIDKSGDFQWSVSGTGTSGTLSADCEWMVDAACMDAAKNIRDLTRHDYKKEENCTVDLNKRFDRVRTVRESAPEVKAYADDATDRVIIDFDDTVKETPKAAMFAAGQFKIRSFAEEMAEFRERESAKTTYVRPTAIVNDPMELVAETTHSLSETPSVEPYCVRHPLRFQLKPQMLFTCVFLCILGMMGWILWQNLTPSMEQKAFEGIAQAYMTAAEAGTVPQESVLRQELQPMVDEAWMKGYRLFLDVWQHTHFETAVDFAINPESEEFPSQQSAAQAAWISWLIAQGEGQKAQLAFDAVPAKVWNEHNYFQIWAMAQLDEDSRDDAAAALKYEKLLKTPLASLALTQLGLISLEATHAQEELRERFLRAYSQVSTPSKLAGCLQAVLTHGKSGTVVTAADYQGLKAQYRAYCLIGQLFSAQENQSGIDSEALAELKSYAPLEHGEFYRAQAVISSELYLGHQVDAVDSYQALDLPEEHPMRQYLRNEILQHAIRNGNWTGLYALYPNLPKNMGYLAALRVIDQVRTGESLEKIDLGFPESLVKYNVSEPAEVSSLMDEAYAEARHGAAEHALSMLQTLRESRPELLEPLFLQAEILSHLGRNQEAAGILEQTMNTGRPSAPLIVISSLYRARANQLQITLKPIFRILRFEDPVLESSRCEILSHLKDREAETCLSQMSSERGALTKSAWIMRHQETTVSSKQWLAAGSDEMSFPGYHLALARILRQESEFSASVRAYANAILADNSTATPDTVSELEQYYVTKLRRYEGAKQFEHMIEKAEKTIRDTELLGALHLSAARLYQPKTAHPMARRHLSRAQELLGDQPEIIMGLIEYYEAKDKPEHVKSLRLRLNCI